MTEIEFPGMEHIEMTSHGQFQEGSVIEQIIGLVNSDTVFSDIFIHEDSPLMLKQPKALVPASANVVLREDLEMFFDTLDPNWNDKIGRRAIDRAVDLSTSRIRANFFTYSGRRKYGAVIRRFPALPLSLDTIGLRESAKAFANLSKGLVLVVGDTGQGKSTTIASLLDRINRDRAGHILTIEDPVETVITPNRSLVTQREVGADGDVESFYMGTLDALRERPDVVLIGEVRESDVARETVALSESGPLVLATMHARSIELALSKLFRLLGGTDSAAQAIAQSLKGVICQALLPSVSGDRYHLATECLTVNADVAKLIENRNFSGVRSYMDTSGNPDCHTMNGDLMALYSANKVSFEDAQRATTDRLKFDATFKRRP